MGVIEILTFLAFGLAVLCFVAWRHDCRRQRVVSVSNRRASGLSSALVVSWQGLSLDSGRPTLRRDDPFESLLLRVSVRRPR
jgi:hypothetical protein